MRFTNYKSSNWVLAAILLLPAVFILEPLGFYLFDLLQSLAVYVLLGYYALAAWWLFKKRWHLGFSSLAGFLVLLAFLLPYLSPEAPRPGLESNLRVAHFNVFKYNTDYEGMVWTARETGADMLSFQEVDTAWARELECGLAAEYPYYEVLPTAECCYGLAVFSKHPLPRVDTVWLGDVPGFSGSVQVGDTAIEFLAAHTSAPTTPWRFQERKRHLNQLAEYVQSVDGPMLVIGDLNAVPWNRDIVNLRESGKLHDSRKDLSPTFPRWLPFVRVPIDYIFHSEELACVKFQTIKSTKSDHFGIVGEYEL